MRFTVDTNVLVYAVDRQDVARQAIARDILQRGQLLDMILTAQVPGEFVNAVRRKNPGSGRVRQCRAPQEPGGDGGGA